MNELTQDLKDYKNMEKKNFNKMNTFYNRFIQDYQGKIDPKYVQLIKEQYRAAQTAKKPNIKLGSKQFFNKDFHFNHFNNDFYRIFWDIDLLMTLISEAGIKPQRIKVKEVARLIEGHFINPEKLKEVKKLKKFDPIILVFYSPINDKILLDGNHRLSSRKEMPHSYIDAYILDDLFAQKGMAGDVFRNLFVLHYNVTTIVKFFDDFSIQKNTAVLDKLLIEMK